jgi:hypothetical protein
LSIWYVCFALSKSEALCNISQWTDFLRWGVGSPTSNPPKLENHLSSAVHDRLITIFTSTLHSCRLSPQSTTWGYTMTWWQGIHLMWKHSYYISKCTALPS